ncbi:MAG TPA: TetR/AcrR family transcriptional regulator [Pseudonocardiaceae bacterium]
MSVAGVSRRERSRRLPRPVRERQILDGATSVFARRGYHAASMDEISEAAGISKPMIYAYLGAKEELFAACVRHAMDRMTELIEQAVTPVASPEQRLWRGLLAFFAFVDEDRDGWNVLHRHAGAHGEPSVPVAAEWRQQMIDLVARLLAEAADATGVTEGATADVQAMAVGLVGAAESLADWWQHHPERTASTLATWLMNLVWLGFGRLVTGQVWRAEPETVHPVED